MFFLKPFDLQYSFITIIIKYIGSPKYFINPPQKLYHTFI